MKLLLLSEFFPQSENGDITGGVEARNFYFAKYAQKLELTIFSARVENTPLEQTIFNAKIKRIGLLYSYTQQGNLFKRLFFLIACVFNVKEKYDFVEGTNFITHLAALLIGWINKISVILWYPDVWVGQWVQILGWKGVVGEVSERIVLFFGKQAKYIAISESTKNKLIKNGINKKNIIVIPCGVDSEEILDIKFQNKTYDLVAVSRLVKYKKTEMVVNVAAENKRSLLIIGDGEEKKNIENIVMQNHAVDKIKIIAKIENHKNLLTAIAQAKIFISASQVEGFDIAAVEAAAIGLPCILSDIPTHCELAKNLTGVLIFHDEKELISMIRNILHNEKYYYELSEANSKNVKKYYWRDIISATEKVYEHDEK